MKLEVIKSYVLVILVGISLILTFALWTFQPNEDQLDSADFVPEDEFNLGGTELTKRDLISPSQIVFGKYNQYFGHANPTEAFALYEDMQSWTLYDFRVGQANGRPNNSHQVELIFPLEIPMDIVPGVFTFHQGNEIIFPDWSFQRMFITFNPNDTLSMTFLSIDGRSYARADVTNKSHYDKLWNKLLTLDGLMEYIELQQSENPIYLPANEIVMNKYTLTANEINPSLLEHALFNNPSEVIRNTSPNNEVYYQDGQRTMRIFSNRLSMEYVNPQEMGSVSMTVYELLERSINNINGYKGWIYDYKLSNIDRTDNLIQYRMFFEDFPVFHNGNLAIIEQQWRNTELYQQLSPMFTIGNIFDEGETSLVSGQQVVRVLEEESQYDLEKISAITFGYQLSQAPTGYGAIRLVLEPTWYIKHEGKWQPIYLDQNELDKGVS